VRNCEKFQALNPRDKKKASNAKRQKTSNATSSNPINVDMPKVWGVHKLLIQLNRHKHRDLREGSVQRNISRTREEMMVHTRMLFKNYLLRRRKGRWS
jgi:hypothetical protein